MGAFERGTPRESGYLLCMILVTNERNFRFDMLKNACINGMIHGSWAVLILSCMSIM